MESSGQWSVLGKEVGCVVRASDMITQNNITFFYGQIVSLVRSVVTSRNLAFCTTLWHIQYSKSY
jgi:hypothetical protein